jgi:glycosyltransferase involved in cell wall biosynthesis
MKVLYICFTDFDNINRGSAVRPYKMYNAFINRGYEVILINGNVQERRKKFIHSKKNNHLENIDYCYIEPSTYPCHPIDYLMFIYIKSLNIPVGLFYRDMYHKFPELFNKKGIKKMELLIRYKFDWSIYKIISKTIFFPSDSMAKYFKFDNKAALPPAGDILNTKKESLQYNVIYVGGVSKRYGTDKLLEAMQIVNDTFKRINLILVCRDYDDTFFKKYENEEWLSIKHVSGEELEQFYSKSDVAIIPIQENEYHNFAVPIKLFEYLSYNMPIITTNCFETARFVRNNQIGIVTNDNAQELAEAIIKLYKNDNEIFKYTNNSKKTLINGNLWGHRVDKIEKYLLDVHD